MSARSTRPSPSATGERITRLWPGRDYPYIDSDCVFCGECVQACPVGALLDKHAMGQGRPWERTQVRTTCPYCGVGCQVDVHVKDDQIVKVTGADAVPNKGKLCVKGRFGWGFVDHPDRLKTPSDQREWRLSGGRLGRGPGPGGLPPEGHQG